MWVSSMLFLTLSDIFVDKRQKCERSPTIDENSGSGHGSISGSRGIYCDESSDNGFIVSDE